MNHLRASALLFLASGSFVFAQDIDESQTTKALCLAVCEAQDLGKLTSRDAVIKLGGGNESVARTVASIVRHQWATLPQDFFDGLTANPKAAYRFLEELAQAPRLSATAWAVKQTQERPNRTLDHRLLALAATGQLLGRAEGRLLLQALGDQPGGDGAYFAALLMPEKVADGLLGRLHQGLMEGTIAVESAAPILDRLSARGVKALLGLAVSLPPVTARSLLRYVHDARPKMLSERVAAALDGRVPLDALWLEFASQLLDTKGRVDRVVALLRDGESAKVRDAAFDLLLSAQALDEPLLRTALDGASVSRIRRIIATASTKLPVGYVINWLQHSPEVALDMARALALRPQLEPDVQRQLLDMLDGLGAADSHTPLYALTALVRSGNADSLRAVWPLVINNVAWRDLLNRLARRDEPFVYELMQSELQAAVAQEDPASGVASLSQQKMDMLRLVLVSGGNQRVLDTLVQNAPRRDVIFVRRCRHYVAELSDAHIQSLFDAALIADDPDVAAELLEWIVAVQPEAVGERLWQLWLQPPEIATAEELLEVVMRLLVAGHKRDALLAQMREAMAEGVLPDKLTSLPYEALNSMDEPLVVADVVLCAEMVLKMPLEDAEGERLRIRRWPDGTVGFPLVGAIGSRLRSADPLMVEQVFQPMVAELQGDPRCHNISRQRLKVLWRSLSSRPDLQHLIGRLTSQLWLFPASEDPTVDPCTDGAAVWLQALQAEHDRDFGKAEALYNQSVRDLLRLPSMRGEARWLLGDRHFAGGDDPVAALSAAPYRMLLMAARKRGDVSAIAIASNLVREFAGHDSGTVATLSAPSAGDSPVGGTPLETGR